MWFRGDAAGLWLLLLSTVEYALYWTVVIVEAMKDMRSYIT